jgi:adenosylcobinamide-GDP ribazoletransferase
MRRFLIALQFLTILPVRIKTSIKKEDFGASLLYFPIIGFLIGLLLSINAFLFSFLPGLVRGAFILIISIIITGGIHLDGFADTCDGFYGNKPKEKILEIMRDSRIGAMGVIGVVSLLLLKFSLIVSLPDAVLWKTLIEMAVFARWSQALACNISCYARSEGKAEYFIGYARKKDVFIGGIFTLGLFLVLMQLKGLILFFLSMLSVLLFLHYIRKKIGGVTGDTIGAVNEFSEAVILLLCIFYQSV